MSAIELNDRFKRLEDVEAAQKPNLEKQHIIVVAVTTIKESFERVSEHTQSRYEITDDRSTGS